MRESLEILEQHSARYKARAIETAVAAAQRPDSTVLSPFRTSTGGPGRDFLDSEATSTEALVEGLCLEAASACAEHPYVLVAVDIVRAKEGPHGVSAYALQPDGTPVGVLDQQWWSRGATERERQLQRENGRSHAEAKYLTRAIEQASRRLEERANKTRAWFVVDGESDRRSTLRLAQTLGRHWFTIRLQRARNSTGRDPQSAATRVQGYVRTAVAGGPSRRSRRATFAVRVVAPCLWLYAEDTVAAMTLVDALEIRTMPRGESPLHWRLWTTYPVTTFDDAKLVLETYAKRCCVDEFHVTWRSGFRNVESSRLRNADAVARWAMLTACVAARMERLKGRSQSQPSLPASVELSAREISALVLLKTKYRRSSESIGNGMPTLSQAVTWLADMGGYMGRRVAGGPPAAITIRQGMECVLMETLGRA